MIFFLFSGTREGAGNCLYDKKRVIVMLLDVAIYGL